MCAMYLRAYAPSGDLQLSVVTPREIHRIPGVIRAIRWELSRFAVGRALLHHRSKLDSEIGGHDALKLDSASRTVRTAS